ncbi:uncharacterized protein F4822DRAFT_289199 [Hypoxylon trugodes]|uniref:uncharacterized protein n=1 Tax=Hypoxylon trugodes TaxID=326681 RepID=UPI00219F4F76|nr:uncharacterized protein F4822DRAFT_289199 [Hypoxylon trugodes]KAI1387635.1 hypothetical protein F4822DRAFT_289199 [Hypoxylon trugodes]
MAHDPTIDHMSIGSLDDDQFYSASSSRITSRHVSLIAASRNLEEDTIHRITPSQPPASPYQPGLYTPISSPGTRSPTSPGGSRSKWAFPFPIRHHHNPKHRHFCPKPLARRLYRTFHGTSDSTPLLRPIANEQDAGIKGRVKYMVSSPTSPIATDRWTPAYAGNHSPCSEGSFTPIDSPLDRLVNMNRRGTDAIVSNIRAYLSSRRHDDCSSRASRAPTANENQRFPTLRTERGVLQGNQTQVNEAAADSYLVTTQDIAGILDIVIAGIRCAHQDGSTAGCLSMLLPKEPLLKPVPKVKAIIPGSPSIADPATTISSVKPSFSMASYSDHHKQYLDAYRTTIISRQSITEVT